eukprot:scaffold40068_cov32-Attheya_sp.AAC.2
MVGYVARGYHTKRGEAATTWRIGIREEQEGRSKSCWEQETADRPPLPHKSGGSGINVGTVGAL